MKRYAKKNEIAALLKNKNVLYVVLFFAIANLFSYLMLKQLDAVAFFIIIGFLTTYFSKNMIIVLLTSMLSTFLLVQINLLGKTQEGFDASGNSVEIAEADKTADKLAEADKLDEADKLAEADMPAAMPAVPAISAGAPPDPVSGTKPIDRKAAITPKPESKTSTAKTTEKFSQNITPARYSALDDDDAPRHKPKVDYAATLETAYDNLDKLLSSDAIRNMSADTGRLAEKQQLLMGNIEKITPIMEKAGSILQGFDMGAITKLMKNVGGNAKMLQDNRPDLDIEGE
jgi:hypothetical protein